MKLEFKTFFSDTVLNLGFQIYQSNKITQIESKEHIIHAQVLDHETYDIEIKYHKSKIEHMTCTCSYADFGYYCMHMAAVCIYLEHSNLIMSRVEDPIEGDVSIPCKSEVEERKKQLNP
ncbi:MAG: SWIM zinc finger family protein [Clostridia bacterium]|nr:SWIM zinc finger family protein [Clostridia bacterium]